jgi:sugar/nucleoside kinase (ribokinase family)
VFAEFRPDLPPAYRRAPFLFLANIAPELQLHVLDQMERPRFVMADTMDLWIDTARPALDALMARVDLMTLNESEARHLTGIHALPRAARALLDQGPSHVLIKKGEHGSILFGRDRIRLMPAFPLEDVHDPTGAGDTFAGGLMGRLAEGRSTGAAALRRAMLFGNVVASFGVEAFGLDRLRSLTPLEIEERAGLFRAMLRG